MNRIGSFTVLGAVLAAMLGCADRNTSIDDADTSQTASSSSDSGEAPGDSQSTSNTPDTTESDTTESDTTESDTSTETGGFVPMTEVGWGDSCMCDTFAQDCPEGEKCVPFAGAGDTWDCVKCVPILGDGAVGEPCSYAGRVQSTDDCDGESFCFTLADEGTCLAFCDGTADNPECDAGTTCIMTHDGNITLCMRSCSPLLQDCSDGEGCFWLNTGFACMHTSPRGNIPTGEPCAELHDCAPGNACAFDAACGGECCAAYCDLDNPACATMGAECAAFFEGDTAPAGFENVGVCLSPP